MSANKLLGQLGQMMPIPQTNFAFHEQSLNLRETPCLLISHSGSTFPSLACSNLLQSFTSHIFVVTSEWDTQIARAVRIGMEMRQKKSALTTASYVFTTHVGWRTAEPTSVSVAATHQLLTCLLLYVMKYVRHFDFEGVLTSTAGSSYVREEAVELDQLNQLNLDAIKDIVGGCGSTRDNRSAGVDNDDSDGGQPDAGKARDTETSLTLRRQGLHWAQHILEGPISWIMSAMYIAGTVIAGWTPLSAILFAIRQAVDGDASAPTVPACDANATSVAAAAAGTELATLWTALRYIFATADAALYIFLPIWTTWLIRLWQRRPLMHRVSGRSLIIGDVPWVAQTIEAFVSKLFALSYSVATVGVYSANPVDHLVHRMTHRVVRGALLAVGRPDGRLNALAASENTVCLTVNQAS